MKTFKKTFSYVLPFSMFLMLGIHSTKQDLLSAHDVLANAKQYHKTSYHHMFVYDINTQKADALIDAYINNATSGINRIIDKKQHTNYVRAVQSELPGAPRSPGHTWHCLYGQSTQLNRAIDELNDTIQIIPKTNNAHQASSTFISQMTKLYSGPEYQNALYRGHLYTTRQEYDRALKIYLKNNMHRKTTNNQDSLRFEYVKKFRKNNHCTDELNPGTIIIVNSGHAVMYLGQGKVKNGNFVPDEKGTAICCSYNAEHSAIPLDTWATSDAFAADIHNIAAVKYKKESERADSIAYAEITEQFNIQNFFSKTLANQK